MSSVYAMRDRVDGRERPASRWLRPLLIGVTALCGAVLLLRFVAEPLMTIRHIVVASDVALSDEQVLTLSGIPAGAHWYSIVGPAVQKKLESNPLIRQASVEKVFPDTVRLTLHGRVAAAAVIASSGGRSLPILVDGEGVVFKVGSSPADTDLPVVSGLTAGDMALGAQLPAPYRAIFAGLRDLREKAPSLFALVSEVRVTESTVPAGVPDLLLYLTSSPVPVRLRGVVDESAVRSTLMVLDLLSRQGVLQDIQELDFRSGDVVYKLNAPAGSSARPSGSKGR
jgi:cell division protein FtsQ